MIHFVLLLYNISSHGISLYISNVSLLSGETKKEIGKGEREIQVGESRIPFCVLVIRESILSEENKEKQKGGR